MSIQNRGSTGTYPLSFSHEWNAVQSTLPDQIRFTGSSRRLSGLSETFHLYQANRQDYGYKCSSRSRARGNLVSSVPTYVVHFACCADHFSLDPWMISADCAHKIVCCKRSRDTSEQYLHKCPSRSAYKGDPETHFVCNSLSAHPGHRWAYYPYCIFYCPFTPPGAPHVLRQLVPSTSNCRRESSAASRLPESRINSLESLLLFNPSEI